MPIKANNFVTKAIFLIALVAIFGLTYWAYAPGLNGPFVFDDAPNILNNPNIALHDLRADSMQHAAMGGASGPLGRPISMLSFALNIYETGYFPYPFKLANLLIHLMAGLGIFLFSAEILESQRIKYQLNQSKSYPFIISLAVTAAWLLHPLNLTGVLYVVQRMTSLSTLFAFWGLYLYAKGRNRLIEGKSGIVIILASLLVFTPLAALSKETGALLPLLMLAMEITLFQFQTKSPFTRKFLQYLFSIAVGIPTAVVAIFLLSHPHWLPDSYIGRDFTLSQRLMTEPRILWFYLSQIVLPNLKALGLFHDDIANSSGLLTPITTLPAIVGIVLLPVAAWFARKKLPILSFGILFFLAGHALESTIFPLEITFEHRNYLPMYGVLLPTLYYLLHPIVSSDTLRLRQLIAVIFIAILSYDTWARATVWATPFDRARDEVEHHPNSARDNSEMGNNYASITSADPHLNDAYYLRALDYYDKSIAVDPNATTGLFASIILAVNREKPVDPRWMVELKRRLQTAHLDNDIGNKLLELVFCEQKQLCKFPKEELRGVLYAPLDNPTVTGGKRALTLSAISYYLVDIESDYPAALNVMHQTIAMVPKEMQYRFSLIKFLIALRHFDEAKLELEAARKVDTLNADRSEFEALEKKILDEGKDFSH